MFSQSSAAVAALVSTALCSQVAATTPHAAGFEVSVGVPVAPRVFDGDVRTLPPIAAKPARDRRRDRPAVIKPAGPGPLIAADAVVLPNMPVPSQHFLGLTSHGDCGGTVCGGGVPPDAVGDVGPNHYIQAVNTGVGIFSKTGTRLAAFTFDGLWAGANTGTACDANNVGDPTVVYDPISDRWFVADFAFTSSSSPPFYECIAVSKTGDPLNGGWYLYAVRADDAAHPYFPDYPKMGIWPDGLYMTANEFEGNTYRGVRIWAFNRQAMVAGQPLQSVIVDTDSASFYSMLPSNLRGSPPPPGTPNYVIMEDPSSYAYDVYKFHVDWVTPSNSTFTGPTKVTQGSYGPPNSSSTYDIIPQADTNTRLDSLGDGLMMQAQYRNIAGTESLWVAHTVRPSGTTSGPTGIQWAQLNVSGGTIATTPVQEQIFTNGSDDLYRWIPSIAVDSAGNAAVGYSASNATSFPSIRYAGRLATDSLNSLAQGEAILFSGTGSQKFNCGGPCSRWGDYSALSVDPSDDCTFWYVNEYYVTTGSSDWQTRIGSFKFPSCNAPTPGPTHTPTQTPTATNTATRTPTSTSTPTALPTNTPTPTVTATNSPTVTPTPSSTQTRTPTATNSPTQTPTATHSPTATRTASDTPTQTATATATSTTTHSPTTTPTVTVTPTHTPTATATATNSPTLTPTPTNTPTQTPTATSTPTVTPTPGTACTLCGDANGDGAIDIVDALFVSQFTVQLRTTLACPGSADVNGNASVDIVDALFISQYTVGLRTGLSCVTSGP